MNLEQARDNMILQQIRTWEVLDSRVLETLRDVPREEFVPPRHRKLAFSDLRIPLGHGQVMLRPIEEGRLLQGLALDGDERVLDVGTGTGFIAACLARLAGRVTSIEIVESLAAQARGNLEALFGGAGADGIDLRTGDVFEAGFDESAFDAIVVTSSVPSIPETLTRWLAPGGRMFIVRGHSPVMEALVVTRTESGHLVEDSLFETDLPRLVGTEEAPRFSF